MAFLRDTMGVSDANAVCVDLWPHILDANEGGPSANAELNATFEAHDALHAYARCVCEVAARLAALCGCELVTLGKLPRVYARTTLQRFLMRPSLMMNLVFKSFDTGGKRMAGYHMTLTEKHVRTTSRKLPPIRNCGGDTVSNLKYLSMAALSASSEIPQLVISSWR